MRRLRREPGPGLIPRPPYHLFRRDIEASILPYAAAHDIGVLVYGPLAHGLLSGTMTADTHFAPGDWRASSDLFRGEPYRPQPGRRGCVAALRRARAGTTVSRLAVAWTLANPAVQVAIVGTRNPRHVDDAIAAAGITLDTSALRRINEIVAVEVPVGGPSPEQMPTAEA